MKTNRYQNFLLSVLALALLLNVLDRWFTPSNAVAAENTYFERNKGHNNCLSVNKNSIKIMEGVNNAERLLGYLESSVNDIKFTVLGIERKLNSSVPNNSWNKGELIVEKN